jgi:hypothetical protein
MPCNKLGKKLGINKEKEMGIKNNISTFQFMIENRNMIIEAVNENLSIPKAWDQLREKLPEAEKSY